MSDQPTLGIDDPEPDEPKYVDKFRDCGRCREKFWSNAAELASRGILFVPLFCEVCSWLNGVELRQRTLRWREKMRRGELRWKPKLSGTTPWEKAPPPEIAGTESAADLLAGVADDLLKPPKKRAKKIAKNP